MTGTDAEVIRLEAAQAALRDHFLGWQCRIRQRQMREFQGRPSEGMSPQVLTDEGDRLAERVIVQIAHDDPEDAIYEFSHAYRATRDPRQRYEKGLKLLSATFYQKSRRFSDNMVAVFGPESAFAQDLLLRGSCLLEFSQQNQSYRIPCKIRRLLKDEQAFQAVWWLNGMFNPDLPQDATLINFAPDWRYAIATPPI
jgi:hypothetical protein